MMLGVTMRMARKEYSGGRFELRDVIACDWPRFLDAALPDLPYAFLPNSGGAVIRYAEKLGVDALILTGGDDWGVFPARDESERLLFDWATEHEFPVFGICRGTQVINRLLGGKFHPCKGHVATRHEIVLRLRSLPDRAIVNSFHNHCIARDELAPGLCPFATTEEGNVEGFWNESGNIGGIIWHPEREKTPSDLDAALVSHFFRR